MWDIHDKIISLQIIILFSFQKILHLKIIKTPTIPENVDLFENTFTFAFKISCHKNAWRFWRIRCISCSSKYRFAYIKKCIWEFKWKNMPLYVRMKKEKMKYRKSVIVSHNDNNIITQEIRRHRLDISIHLNNNKNVELDFFFYLNSSHYSGFLQKAK